MRDSSSRERWKALRDTANGLERLAAAEGWKFTYELTPATNTEGTESMNMIVPNEGETMVEAMTRMAKEQAKSNPALSDKQRKKIDDLLPTAPKAKKASSKSPKPAQIDTKEQIKVDEGQPIDREIHSAIHIYKRDGETDGKVRWNANHERELHGPGTVIFCHLHSFGDKCSSACKAKVEAE